MFSCRATSNSGGRSRYGSLDLELVTMAPKASKVPLTERELQGSEVAWTLTGRCRVAGTWLASRSDVLSRYITCVSLLGEE